MMTPRIPSALFVAMLCSCGSRAGSTPPSKVNDAAVTDHAIHSTVTPEPGGLHYQISGTGVPLDQLPMVAWIGLPMSGAIDLSASVHVPLVDRQPDFRGAHGEITIRCPAGCRLGDDRAKVHGRGTAPFASELEFGHVTFERIDVKIVLDRGTARISRWHVESRDVELHATGQLELSTALKNSPGTACLRFRPTAELRDRDSRLFALLETTGGPLASDGLFHIKLQGRVDEFKRLGVTCDGSAPVAPSVPSQDPGDGSGANAGGARSASAGLSEADLVKRFDRGIKRLSATSYEVDRTLMAEVAADPLTLARGARIVPAVKNGKPDGFKLYAIQPTSLFARLGFANGDSLRQFNARDLSSDGALELYAWLLKREVGQTVIVTGDRRGRPLTLTYRVR